MTKDTRVQTRDICTNCTMGVISNPIWEKWSKQRETFWDTVEENWSSSKRNDESDKWLKDHPYPDYPEEDICPECEGTSIVLRWITIDEFVTECRLFFDTERNHSHPCCEEKND